MEFVLGVGDGCGIGGVSEWCRFMMKLLLVM